MSSYSPLRIVATIEEYGEKTKLINLFFSLAWGQGKDIGDENVLRLALAELELEVEAIMGKSEESAIRKKIKLNCRDATEKKVFGVPTFIVNDELFWGNDSIPNLERHMQGEDPLDMDSYLKFKSQMSEL